VAAQDARFVPAFIQRAIVPDGAMAFLLPRMIGMARTKDFLIRGRELSAVRAEEIGLISEVVDTESLADHAAEIAAQLAALPTTTVSLTKQMLAQSFDQDLAATLFAERASQGLSSATDDAREGKASFIERRPPTFTGR
jgi:2-(1,2-epoxy-1,2-dihydrophenyl)acetyl-CoA isomerase